MRISDWSSDVCSSDLRIHARRLPDVTQTVSGYILTLSPLTASGRRSAAPLVVVVAVIPDIATAERRQQLGSDGPGGVGGMIRRHRRTEPLDERPGCRFGGRTLADVDPATVHGEGSYHGKN